MATQQLSSKPERRRNRTSKDAHRRNKHGGGTPVAGSTSAVGLPDSLRDAIDSERDTLAKAESVLGCLVNSMESDNGRAPPPYYPDVAQIARELVRRAINGLDSLNLDKCLPRNRIEEAAPQRELSSPLAVSVSTVAETYH